MGLRALLLSPDDQAVNAITGVLEELSVSCERPLDGVSAAKKLNSERFDLVLVDCDNLPAAKLIFDVCRRSHGAASLPVAIVDGRVGLPTAFRLGAELILTKPVAKDQARITVRTAVGRMKKDQPTHDDKPADPIQNVEAHHQETETVAPKALAQAAAAGAGSSLSMQAVAAAVLSPALPPHAELGKTEVAASSAFTMAEEPAKPKAEVASTPAMSSAPAVGPVSDEVAAKPVPAVSPRETALKAAKSLTVEKRSTASPGPRYKASSEKKLSDDPVIAAMENDEPRLASPMFSNYQEPKRGRGRGLLVAVLVIALLAGGFYAGWTYQPGFREFVQAQLSQVQALIGSLVHNSSNVTRPPAEVPKPAPAAAPPQTAPPEAAAPSPTNTPAAPASTTASEPSPPAPAHAAEEAAPVEDQNKVATPAAPAPTAAAAGKEDFFAAKNAVILSSKGAEKRLLHRVAPVRPAGMRAKSLEATIVLKAAIDENGAVQALQSVEGDPVLAAAAMKAVKQWRYKPFTRDGKAVPFQTIVLVDFQ